MARVSYNQALIIVVVVVFAFCLCCITACFYKPKFVMTESTCAKCGGAVASQPADDSLSSIIKGAF